MHPTIATAETRSVDVVCVGECMVMFVPDQLVPPPRQPLYRPTIAGAESNVAGFLANFGVSTAWVSRLGHDDFGDFVAHELAELGVDVHGVARDSHRHTGVAFKDRQDAQTRVRYYRHGSAASVMGDDTRETVAELGGRILHLSGITPALSDSCHRLVHDLMLKRQSSATVSFDVNWRPHLWRGKDPSVLLDLARAADIVFLGDDEATALWSATTVKDVRTLLPDTPTLVVKHGARGATVCTADTEVFVPALKVDVVEPVGAGDAFAAGYLAGTLDGRDLQARARLGTIFAAAALGVTSDIASLPSHERIEAMLSLSEAEWKTANGDLHISHGG